MFVLEPESTESLEATLAFLDEALSSPSSSDSHSSDRAVSLDWRPDATRYSAPSKQPPSNKKARKCNPNKAREDRNRELNYLRNEVEELEFKLSQLQAVKANRAIGLADDQGTLSLLLDDAERKPFVWERTCARQLESRLRAERANLHLKTLLEKQIQVAKSMEKLLNKRTTLTAAETSGSSKRTSRVHVSREGSAAADAAMYDELNVGVDASYREVDAVFGCDEFISTNGLVRKAQVRDDTSGMYLEIYDSKVMPFNMHATGEAWWRRWNHFNPNRCGFRIESTDDSIVEHFGMEMSDTKTKTSAKFYVQQRLRRYVEEDRVVVVWQSHIEPLEFSNKKLAGIRFREKGYVAIKPYEDSSAGDDEPYTLVQTCYKITPDLSDQRLTGKMRIGALTEFVVSATVDNISASTEMIENLLVDSQLHLHSHM